MPRITKDLPESRADYSFGDLVYWHLFKYGSRPEGDPADTAGRVWEMDAVCELLDITDKTLRNWISDKNIPDSFVPLSNLLFGNSKLWNRERSEFQEKFEKGQAAKRRKGKGSQAERSAEAEAGATQANPGADQIEEPPDPEPSPPEEPPTPAPSRAVVVTASLAGHPDPKQNRSTRQLARAIAATLAVVLGVYGWIHITRQSDRPTPAPQPKTTTEVTSPPRNSPQVAQTAPAVSEPKVAMAPPVAPAPPVPQPSPAPAPAEPPPQASTAPAPTVPPPQSSAPPSSPMIPPAVQLPEKPAGPNEDEQRRIDERLAAYDREINRQVQEAVRHDTADPNAERQAQREREARQIAGMGYRLRENTYVPESSFANLLVETVAECAAACTREKCDAFAFKRDQTPSGVRHPRYCYLHRKPFTPRNNPDFVLGEPMADAALAPSTLVEAPIRVAQAGPPGAPPPADGVTRCANGPVKVTGFKLTCDQILGGGTSPGAPQERFTVANINECAAKCRPYARCTGFTFNAGDPVGRHACQIFGGRPEPRETSGWISGVR